MESKKELKEINIKNHTCYYFDDIIKIKEFDLNNILIDKKSYKSILFYNISYKSLIDFQPLHIRFKKIDVFIRASFRSEKDDSIYNRIRYLISVKSGITYIISHIYAKIKLDS